jgi:hypothetical protein
MAMQVAGHLCWLKNGAWRAPCDDPYLAKAAGLSPYFCQIWFASRYLLASLSLFLPHAQVTRIYPFMVSGWPPSSFFMIFHLLFLLISSYILVSLADLLETRRESRDHAAGLYRVANLL